MLFNSYGFIFIFLPITLIGYYLIACKNVKISKLWLILASLYFYSYLNRMYLLIIIGSILINYLISKEINVVNKNMNFFLLVLGICFNLGSLGYFKYYNFFISSINNLFNINIQVLHIMLPLGISFFTFQQISYIVDSYYQRNKDYNFLSYCLFVSFFPQIIAGPIVLPEEMLPQFENENNIKVNWKNMNRGIYMFSIGLAKKVLIADILARFVNAGFDIAEVLYFPEAWITALSYSLQLYFDFSGYCDMAIGIGLMFNIELPINFNSPYKSCNFQEFWRKWHITLGRFMTNYLYIPLGGNRYGELKTLRNLFVVFLLSGIWHGAGWNYIIWGCLHGICILIHRIWKKFDKKLPKILGWFLTFNLVNIFWIFFRAKNIETVIKILRGMSDYKSLIIISQKPMKVLELTLNLRRAADINLKGLGNKETVLIFTFSLIVTFIAKNSNEKMKRFKEKLINNFEIAFYICYSICCLTGISTFLYFNF